MSIDVPRGVKSLSSIAARPDPSQSTDWRSNASNPSTDPLDGSLGLYVLMCVLVLALVLGVALVLWRIRRPRNGRVIGSPHQVYDSQDVYLPAFNVLSTESVNSVSPRIKLPPSLLRIRTPIQKLKLFRSKTHDTSAGSTAIPLWTTTMTPAPSAGTDNSPVEVPAIVISRCSPILGSPPFTTLSSESFESLQVPRTRWVSPQPAAPEPFNLTAVVDAPSPLQTSPMNQLPKARGLQLGGLTPKRLVKGKHRRTKSIGNKENSTIEFMAAPPTRRPSRILGLRQ